MTTKALTRTHLILLFTLSLVPRLVGAFWLPNAFGDAYAYTEQIYYLRRSLLNGSFSLSSLFGFWLPLYQFVCAGISALVGSPFYVPKLVSIVCGGGVCVLTWLLTWELTKSRQLAIATTAVVILNPYHILYSSSAMTDVPHAFLILLCAFCCVRNRWLAAALCALGAGLIRIESWTLILLIPLAHFWRQSSVDGIRPRLDARRFVTSTLLCLLMLTGPLYWLLVSWSASGSLWKYFEIRNNYIVVTLASSPPLAHFSVPRVAYDLLRLVYTSNPLVIYGSVVVLAVLIKGAASFRSALRSKLTQGAQSLLGTSHGLLLLFFFSHLLFLLLAYFTSNQPEIWPRYGLIFFTLGLPLFATLFEWIWRGKRIPFTLSSASPTLTSRVVVITVVIFGLQFCAQLIDATRMVVKTDPHVIAAEFLEDERLADRATTIYCEDGAIRVLSGIPLEEFKDQYNSPADDDAFLESLRENHVRFLVYKDLPGSRLKGIIARILARQGNKGITLEEVLTKPRKPARDKVLVYRVHGQELAVSKKPRPTQRPKR